MPRRIVALEDLASSDTAATRVPLLSDELTGKSMRLYLLDSVQKFFRIPENLNKMLFFLKHHPLRILEWAVINYSKELGIAYLIKRPNGTTREFRILSEYQNKLSSLGKPLFDMYSRGPRTVISYETGNPENPVAPLETTLAQLSFFMWAIEYLVIDYVVINMAQIRKHLEDHDKPSLVPSASDVSETSGGKIKKELCQSYLRSVHIELETPSLPVLTLGDSSWMVTEE